MGETVTVYPGSAPEPDPRHDPTRQMPPGWTPTPATATGRADYADRVAKRIVIAIAEAELAGDNTRTARLRDDLAAWRDRSARYRRVASWLEQPEPDAPLPRKR